MKGYLISHPDYARHILNQDQKMYEQTDPVSRRLQAVFGDGLVASDKDTWLIQRKAYNPHFRHKSIDQLSTMLLAEIDKALSGWKELSDTNTIFNMVEEMRKITLQAAARAFFSIDLNSERDEIFQAVEFGSRYMTQDFPFNVPSWIPIPANIRLKKADRYLKGLFERVVEKRRQKGIEHTDLASSIFQTWSGNSAMQFDDFKTFLATGFVSLTATLSWFWRLIGAHPKYFSLLGQEVERNKEKTDLKRNFIPDYPLLSRMINETLRLYPVGFSVWRKSLERDSFDDYVIPKNAWLCISIYNIHRNPKIWNRPEQFDPDRHLPEGQQSRPKHHLMPFGRGPRKCIGDHYVMLMLHLVIIRIMQKYSVDVLSEQDSGVLSAPIYTPRSVRVRIYEKSMGR